jgi:hypothetical protein
MVTIDYYVYGDIHSSWSSEYVPRIGDEVELGDAIYAVVRIVWQEDVNCTRRQSHKVRIDIKPR